MNQSRATNRSLHRSCPSGGDNLPCFDRLSSVGGLRGGQQTAQQAHQKRPSPSGATHCSLSSVYTARSRRWARNYGNALHANRLPKGMGRNPGNSIFAYQCFRVQDKAPPVPTNPGVLVRLCEDHILTRILFGSFRCGTGSRHSQYGHMSQFREKWMNMSEEERKKYKEEWKKCCSHNEPENE